MESRVLHSAANGIPIDRPSDPGRSGYGAQTGLTPGPWTPGPLDPASA